MENTNIKIKTRRKFESRLSPRAFEAVNLPSSFPWWRGGSDIVNGAIRMYTAQVYFKWNLGLVPYFTAGGKESMTGPTFFLPQEWHLAKIRLDNGSWKLEGEETSARFRMWLYIIYCWRISTDDDEHSLYSLLYSEWLSSTSGNYQKLDVGMRNRALF